MMFSETLYTILAFFSVMAIIVVNSTPHASRKICAPRGVTFFKGVC